MNEKGYTIKWKVKQQAKTLSITNPHQLALLTRLTYSSVLDLWNNNSQGVNIVTLEILKLHLQCQVTDLYEIKWNKKNLQLY